MQGNETQVFTLHGEDGPERTRDSYGVDGVAFSGFRVFYVLQVEPRGTSELIEIHLRQGPKGLN